MKLKNNSLSLLKIFFMKQKKRGRPKVKADEKRKPLVVTAMSRHHEALTPMIKKLIKDYERGQETD